MAYPFIESPHVTRTGGKRQIDLIVIHTMEMDEKGETAENCAQWFRNPGAKVSAHYCVDANSIVQCVRDQDVGWHAPGANHDGIGIEHAGRAKQTGRDWSDPYSKAMLERSATLVAELCKKYKIPVDLAPRRRPEGRQAGDHDAQGGQRRLQARHALGSRPGIPGRALPRARARPAQRRCGRRGAGCEPGLVKPDPPLLRKGAEGWQVKRLQKLLREHGHLPEPAKIDGDFGEITEAAVKAFQKEHDLTPDGIAGPLTWRALEAADVRAVGGKALQPA